MARLEDVIRRRLQGRAPRQVATKTLRPAAVLVPLIRETDDYRLLLTVRASSLRRQPGDISFPGGAIDADDASPLTAALRESEEEVGLEPADVDVLGQMDEIPTITGFRITPFVGLVHCVSTRDSIPEILPSTRPDAGPYAFRRNHEVEELLFVPLAILRRPDVVSVELREIAPGCQIPVYHYRYDEHHIWGITGRLVKELLELLEIRSP